METAERGPIMDLNLNGDVPPLDLEVARGYFRELILGVEYCIYTFFFDCQFSVSISRLIFSLSLSFSFFLSSIGHSQCTSRTLLIVT